MTQAQKLADLSQAFTAGPLGFRNLLLNPLGLLNQRQYASGAAVGTSLAYTLDRWRVVVSGQSLAYVANGLGFAMTAPAGGVEQPIEGQNIIGGKYCLSWAGTATATVNGTPVANGGNIALPAATDATVRFSGGTVYAPQLEIGVVPTVFDLRPIWLERLACMRYYQRWTGTNLQLPVTSGAQNTALIMLPVTVPMRVSNPGILTNGIVGANYSGSASPNANQWTMGSVGVTYHSITGGAMSVTTIGQQLFCGLACSGMSLSAIPNFAVIGANLYAEAIAEL